jgi:hypothetical protein
LLKSYEEEEFCNVGVLQAQDAQEEIDAAYEAKHSAKEGNHAFKRPAPRKQAAPKAKKTEPVDEDLADEVPAAVAPVLSKPVTSKKLLDIVPN